MAEEIRKVELLSDGLLLLLLNDGREALVRHEDLIDCAEKTGGYDKAEALQREYLDD